MACLLVPAAEAAAVTLLERRVAARKTTAPEVGAPCEEARGVERLLFNGSIPLARKLRWLSGMLWGGTALLMLEHVWHGEISPFFPFLTALRSPADTLVMLREMATVGVGMAVLVTAVWVVGCVVAERSVRRAAVRA